MDNILTVLQMSQDLKMEILCCQELANSIYIKNVGITRVGLELTGAIVKDKKIGKTILLGSKECKYLDSLKSKSEILKSLSYIFADYQNISAIILSKSFKQSYSKILINIAKQNLIPILQSKLFTYETILYVLPYINAKLWKREEFHATLVSVFGEGVLLTGESAVGKSETALGLIKHGHYLVADDRVALYSSGVELYGEPGNNISRLLEIRGIGIIDVRYMYGHHVVLSNCPVNLNINLVAENDKTAKIDRIGLEEETINFFHHDIPKINIRASAARNLVDLVETAVIYYKLKKEGHNPIDHLEKFLTAEIQKNSKIPKTKK